MNWYFVSFSPFCGYITFCFSGVGHLCCSSFLLLQVMLLWTPMWKFLCGHMLLFLLSGISLLWVKLLSYGSPLFNVLRNCQTVFWKWLHHFKIPATMCEGSNFSHLCQHLLLSVSFIHPRGCEVVFIMALVCISLMTNDTEHLFKSLLVICYTCFGEMSIVFINWECYNRIP